MSLPDLSPDPAHGYKQFTPPFRYNIDSIEDARGLKVAGPVSQWAAQRIVELMNADAEGRLTIYQKPVPETEEEQARRLKGTVSPTLAPVAEG